MRRRRELLIFGGAVVVLIAAIVAPFTQQVENRTLVSSVTQRETTPDKILGSPAQIDALVKGAQRSVAAGDFDTARRLFREASDAGNAAASLALAASYDPIVLSRLDARGVDSDINQARRWYQVAKDRGAPDADRRLKALPER